jgi:hypothetical protein
MIAVCVHSTTRSEDPINDDVSKALKDLNKLLSFTHLHENQRRTNRKAIRLEKEE